MQIVAGKHAGKIPFERPRPRGEDNINRKVK
jgi:hypothetical protein